MRITISHIPILFQDEHVVAVDKRSGLLVHRTALDRHAREFALQSVRDQIGRLVYPVHRLDRATSGALIFATSSETARELCQSFASGRVKKTYLAVVRGTPPEAINIDHPLIERLDRMTDSLAERDKPAQPAKTRFERLATCELPFAVDKFPTSRYSLVRATPETGRKHQIRRHLRHIFHPIVGDVTYGSGKHNRFFRNQFDVHRLLLACTSVEFPHPATGSPTRVRAPLAGDFRDLIAKLGWSEPDV